MSTDIDIEAGVSQIDSQPCSLLSAKNLSENIVDDPNNSCIALELKEIPHIDCDDVKEEPQETDVLLEKNQECALRDCDHVETVEESDVLNQTPRELKRKRGSTIDVVNCDETTESTESDCQSGDHLSNPKEEAAEEEPAVEEEEDNELFDFREMAAGAMRHAEELIRRMLLHVSWTICHFHALPKWLQDNDFIWQGYRPPLPSFWDCIKSIFSIHTETGNIWTHMLGKREKQFFFF